MFKVCNKCGIEKDIAEFAARNRGKCCRVCDAAYIREYRRRAAAGEIPQRQPLEAGKKHCPKCNQVYLLEEYGHSRCCRGCEAVRTRASYAKHRAARCARRRERYTNDPGFKSRQLAAGKKNRDSANVIERRAYRRAVWSGVATDPNFRLHRALRQRIRNAVFRAGSKKSLHTEELLGQSISGFRDRLERLFTPRMTWNNYGAFWEIGHKKPVTSFNLSDIAQQKECFHYSNLFPQEREENRSSGATFAGVNFLRLRATDYIVRRIEGGSAREIVEQYHYSQRCPKVITVAYGLFHRDRPEDLLGASVWMPPAVAAARSVCAEAPEKVISLSRLALVPELPKNAASYFLAQSTRLLKAEKRWGSAITYADSWQGHSGAIYKAANWTDLGETPPYPVWTRAGRLVSSRRGPRTLTFTELIAEGSVLEGYFSKRKFFFSLR